MDVNQTWANLGREFCHKQTHFICRDILFYMQQRKRSSIGQLKNNNEIHLNKWFLSSEEPSTEIKKSVDDCFGTLQNSQVGRGYDIVVDISIDGSGETSEILLERWMFSYVQDTLTSGPKSTLSKFYKELSLHFRLLTTFLFQLPRVNWIRKRTAHDYYTDVLTTFHIRTQTSLTAMSMTFDTSPKQFVFKTVRGSSAVMRCCVLFRTQMPQDKLISWSPILKKSTTIKMGIGTKTIPIPVPRRQRNDISTQTNMSPHKILSAPIYDNYVASPTTFSMSPSTPPQFCKNSTSPYSMKLSTESHCLHKPKPVPSYLQDANASDIFFAEPPPFASLPEKNIEYEISEFLKVINECKSSFSKNTTQPFDLKELDKKLRHFQQFNKDYKIQMDLIK
jgi:hypothetical protein